MNDDGGATTGDGAHSRGLKSNSASGSVRAIAACVCAGWFAGGLVREWLAAGSGQCLGMGPEAVRFASLGTLSVAVLVCCCIGYLALCGMAFLFQYHLVYHPSTRIAATPLDCGLHYEGTELPVDRDGPVVGWFVPAPEERGVILFCHGNAGNVGDRLDTIEVFHGLGFSVFIFDYRGYGRSLGKATEAGTYEDAEVAWRYLTDERGFRAEQIVVFGRSLGGAIAAWLAARHIPGVLVLESTFTSVVQMGRELYPFLPIALLSRFRYSTASHLAGVGCPVVVVHSSDDELVGIHHGRELYELAPGPKHFVALRGPHNDGFLVSGEDYITGLDGALSAYFPR